MKSSHRRWSIWIPLLVITVGLSIFDPEDADSEDADSDLVHPVARAATKTPAEAALPTIMPDDVTQQASILQPRMLQDDLTGLFGTGPQRVAIPAVTPAVPVALPVPVEAPVPAVPPLPLRFLGRMERQGQPVLFLMWGEKNIAMKVGDVLEGTYRLEQIKDTQAEFTYLPQGQKQLLALTSGA